MSATVCSACGQRYDHAGYCTFDGQPLVATDDPLLGTEVGRYRMARVLGEGGMGRVYLAVQPAIGSRVAIKILSDQCARSPELLDRFFSEARAVNLIHHENIVSVIDMAQLADGRPFIIMEYVEGKTLAQLARAGQLPLGGLISAMTEVLSALAAAHAIGIIHRDLKPDNILVTGEGHAKVLDFGIAKLAPELQQQLSPRTRTGALLGTPQYMAPEQISGSGGVDPRTDLYAAGVVLYELATGRLPFIGETLFDLMRAHLEQPPVPPRQVRRDLPAALEHVILTALAKRPDDRFASAPAMAQALHQAASALPAEQWRSLSGRGPSASSPSGSGRTPSGELPLAYRATRPVAAAPTVDGSGRVGLIIGAIVVAAAAVAVVLFFLLRRDREPPQPVTILQPAPTPVPVPPVAPAQPTPAPTPEQPATPVPEQTAQAPATPVRTAPHTTHHSRPGGGDPAPAAPTKVAQADPGGPTIVGGGSAADHGVYIGPNVTMGPNVIIGSNTPSAPAPAPDAAPDHLSRGVDYNPKRFDPVAYLPKAEALARQLLPDARLTRFEFDPVFPDGHTDLTLDSRDHGYDFRSPERSTFPAGRPRNMPIDRKCRVSVDVTASGVTARVLGDDHCTDKLIRAPRCSLAAVWKLALASGMPSDVVARIAWLSDEAWFFDIDLDGKGIRNGVSTLADHCP